MKLSDALEGYILSASSEGYSPLTLESYRSSLITMFEYLGDKELGEVTTEDLRLFMRYLVKITV